MTDLSGRVAVITGGTRGIGWASAEALAEAGATVLLGGTDAGVAGERAKDLSTRYGVPAEGFAADVADAAAVASVFKDLARVHGRFDALVACAGFMEGAPIGMIRPEAMDRALAVNVAGTIACVQAAARVMMRKRSGSIVLLGSVVGERGAAGQVVYAATKAAVSSVAKSAARELGPRGVRVNAVAPGLIETDLLAGLPEDVKAARVSETALGRLGRPEDVARVVRFLVGDDSSFVTGQVLGVDGGLVL